MAIGRLNKRTNTLTLFLVLVVLLLIGTVMQYSDLQRLRAELHLLIDCSQTVVVLCKPSVAADQNTYTEQFQSLRRKLALYDKMRTSDGAVSLKSLTVLEDIQVMNIVWSDAGADARMAMIREVASSLLSSCRTEIMQIAQHVSIYSLRFTQLLAADGLFCLLVVWLIRRPGHFSISQKSTDCQVLNDAIAYSPCPTAVLSRELNIRYANAALSTLAGVSQTELVNTNLRSVVQSEKLDALDVNEKTGLIFSGIVHKRSRSANSEHRETLRIWLGGVALPNMGTVSDQWLIFANLTDVSVELQAVDLKRDVLAIAGHELRSPLTSIPALIGLAYGDLQEVLPEDELQKLSVAESELQKLCILTGSIMEMAAGDIAVTNLTLSVLEIKNLFANCLVELKRAAEQRTVRLSVERAQGALVADKVKFARAVKDLVQYAIELAQISSDVKLNSKCDSNVVRIDISFQQGSSTLAVDRLKQTTRLAFPFMVLRSHGGTVQMLEQRDSEQRVSITLEVPTNLISKNNDRDLQL